MHSGNAAADLYELEQEKAIEKNNKLFSQAEEEVLNKDNSIGDFLTAEEIADIVVQNFECRNQYSLETTHQKLVDAATKSKYKELGGN